MEWPGRKVLIVGAARQGVALARYLAQSGAEVVLNDLAPFEKLADAHRSLADIPIQWVYESHPLEILDGVDLLCPSGGVPLDLPLIGEARKRGIPLSNDSQIFLESTPCKVVGITGSAGKTTTTALVGNILSKNFAALDEEGAHGAVWVGGNIGNPLISDLERIRPEDIGVMELSSFQLEIMTRSPEVSAVLNVTPNHLDRHKSMAAYSAAKQNILNFQSRSDVAVLNRDDEGAWTFRASVRGNLVAFTTSAIPEKVPVAFLREGWIILRVGGIDEEVIPVPRIPLRGPHNVLNVLAASAIAQALNVPVEKIRAGIESFAGLPHRLELIREWGGARWYNDSIATAPERTIAALKSFRPPIVLLAGGRDKDLPWDALASEISQRVDHLIAFGEAAPIVIDAVGRTHPSPGLTISSFDNLAEATTEAARLVEPGDTVLLAPGGTSFDEFRDFEERGDKFRQWVNDLS